MSENLRFDVLVIGGGPAGSICAAKLAQDGARVGLVERTDYSEFRIGETLDSLLVPPLAKVGFVLEEKAGVVCRNKGMASVWESGIPRYSRELFSPLGKRWLVDRRRFDLALCEHASISGVSVFLHSKVTLLSRRQGWWEFALTCGNRSKIGRCYFVVEATGRNSQSQFSPDSSRIFLDSLFGIAVVSKPLRSEADPLDGNVLIEATSDGWWYSCYLPNQQLLIVFFTDVDLLSRGTKPIDLYLKEKLSATQYLKQRIDPLKMSFFFHPCRVFDARSSLRRVAVSNGWVATGDALMAIDPLSGKGVCNAVESGIETANWITKRTPVRESIPEWAYATAKLFDEYELQRRAMYHSVDRWNDSIFWKRRRLTHKYVKRPEEFVRPMMEKT